MPEETNKSTMNSVEDISGFIKNLKPSDLQIVFEELKNLTTRYVRRMRILPFPDFDFNSYPFMYKIIAEELFTYSQEHPQEKVKMFIGDIKSEFYGKNLLFDKVSELAAKGIKFDIILAKPPSGEYLPRWRKLMTDFPNCVNVRMKPNYSEQLCHLILVGDAYRMEAPHEMYEGPVTDLLPLRPARFGFHDRPYAENVVLEYWETEAVKDVQGLPVGI